MYCLKFFVIIGESGNIIMNISIDDFNFFIVINVVSNDLFLDFIYK